MTGRFTYSLAFIRAFGQAGHDVYVTDTFDESPGSHLRFTKRHFVTAEPRYATRRFIDDLCKIIELNEIDLLIPTGEEIIYEAAHFDELSEFTRVFASPFELLAELHNKATFKALCSEMDVRVPITKTVTTLEDFHAAADEIGAFFARPAYSRGAMEIVTNRGILAGGSKIDDFVPSNDNPWLVQEYVDGEDICSFGIATEGNLCVHTVYNHPTLEPGEYGIRNESIDVPATLPLAKKLVATTLFTGSIAFDYKRTGDGELLLIECNPRATQGAILTNRAKIVDAIVNGWSGETWVEPAGNIMQLNISVVDRMMRDVKHVPESLPMLMQVADPYFDTKDVDALPGLFELASFRHFARIPEIQRSHWHEMYVGDLTWDGEEIE